MFKKKRIWLSPCPGVGYRAVILKKWWIFNKVLYRDYDGKCYISWEPDSEEQLILRSK